MERIVLHHPLDYTAVSRGPLVMALGFFDGVHRGHQAVIKRARREADKLDLPLAVMTFNVSPRVIYRAMHPSAFQYLTTLAEKERLMASLGVDYFYVIEMTSAFATQSPADFVENYLVGLHVRAAVAGFDYTYGDPEIANMANLPRFAAGRFAVITVPKKSLGAEKIGSRTIRQLLNDGDVDTANQMLGYPYYFSGRVVNGEHRGRLLGFPTANLTLDRSILLPKVGVYVVECVLNHRIYWGMASIGYNITFGDHNDKTVEINLFDFDQQIYGEELKVYWHHRLRDELKFDGEEALIAQMQSDRAHSLAFQKQYEADKS